ncbi:MAG: hypothetical protein H6737_15735 [Alphaproteobacteria bacterium]|nr:hypothetical protein [Phycisphaerales bacterium]MCB9676567.1 hypothetical protein [Alphaproteobacteria bacterium]
MRHAIALSAILLAGCPLDSDIDTDDPVEPPDITGVYTVAPLTDVAGCEGVAEADVSWMEGALVIEGTPDALTFTFAGGEVLEGSVDEAFTWAADGTVSAGAGFHDVAAEGLAFIGDVTWILDGDVAVDVLDSTEAAPTCTLTGRLEAEQDPP